MAKDPVCGVETEKCDVCGNFEEEVVCRCPDGNSEPRRTATNVIDLKQRGSELRKKGISSGGVSSFEASRALAFGMMHLTGEGVPRDPSKAAAFLATAAKGEAVHAMHELAQLHIEGAHVPYDPEYAITLLQSAAEQEYLPSMVYLSELYIFGKHCPRDIEAALELLYFATGSNEPSAMYYLAYIYDKIPQYKNPHEAAYWYRRTAEHGHFKSMIKMASCYATGEGVPCCRDSAEAFLEVALESAAEQDPRLLLWQGERLALKPETQFLGRALIKAAADLQHTPAQRAMLQHGWRAS